MAVTNTIDELHSVALKFKDKGVDVLAINGGDGTISLTLTAFIKAYGGTPLPRIAILGGGTINVLRTNLGIRGRPEDVLFRLVEHHSANAEFQLRSVPTLEVDGNYGFLFGDGVAASFLEVFYKNKTNALGSALLLAKIALASVFDRTFFQSVINSRNYDLRPHEGRHTAVKAMSVMCSTLRLGPMGIPYFNMLATNPDKMECISFQLEESGFLWQLPFMVMGAIAGMNLWQQRICTSLMEIEADSNRAYTIDGELFRAKGTTITVHMGPRLEFVII
jgi:diacylglycerol kinase family enzyme